MTEMEGSKELKGVPRAHLVGKPNQKSAKQMLHSIINIPNQNSLAIEAFFSVMSPLVEGSRVRGRIIITVLCAAPHAAAAAAGACKAAGQRRRGEAVKEPGGDYR